MRLLFPSISLLLALDGFAQPQPDNPSFEPWTNAGQAVQEPTDWSSLKTSDGGAIINGLVPQLCWRSTDAHTGSYSVNLRTVSSVAGTANGLLTNGRVHAELAIENSYMFTVQNDAQWSTSMTSRPDSLVGWFKADPETGDRPNIGALLHVGDGRLPAFGTENNWVAGASWKGAYAQVTEWTRFSTDFEYLNDTQPEWILFILTAGDSAGSQVGTQVWYDDLALIYNVHCLPTPNPVVMNGTDPFELLVDYSTGGIPVAPTTFTVELSDPSGAFNSPTVIGSLTSSAPTGAIPCSIPVGTAPSMAYRIRVATPSPFYSPVPGSLVIEGATGIGNLTANSARCWSTSEGIVVDLIGTGLDRPSFELFDSTGRLLSTGSLQEEVLNTIPSKGELGLYLLRVGHADGSMVFHLLRR